MVTAVRQCYWWVTGGLRSYAKRAGGPVGAWRCRTQVSSWASERAERQLGSFFSEALSMDRAHLRRLRKAGRHAPGRPALETNPEFLAAVTSETWTANTELLVRQIWAEAAAVAQRLSPHFGRRAVTRGLAGAALVIVTACGD